ARKGFYAWLAKQNADFVCLQETKAQRHQLTDPMFSPENYFVEYKDAVKKGYSGVALYSKFKPNKVVHEMNFPLADEEGRFLQFDFDDFSVISIYLPSGTSGDARQALKYKFLHEFYERLKKMRQQKREYIICGDWNIAHKQIDLKNWRSNQKNSGFLPQERAWLDEVFDKVGYVDAFRVINQEPEQYTWWSNRGQAWAKNVGWRIDYHVITPGLKNKIKKVAIYKEQRFSDHAPLIIDYAF
ncbi:MAG: exodeoxyribonuclease III, partial [Pseudomonadota bacterium]